MARRFAILAPYLILVAVGPLLRASEPRRDRYGDPLPPRAVMRLGTIRLRHADAEVAFSPDGKQLISCGKDGEVRFWDAADGRLLQRQRLPIPAAEEIDKTALSRDGTMAATCNSNRVRLLDTRTGKEIGRLSVRTAAAGSLTFSPDGRFLALCRKEEGKNDQILWVCSTVPFKLLRTVGETFADPVVFSADGKRLAGIVSMSLRVWDVLTGKEIPQGDNPMAANSLSFSPDGKLLAVGSQDEGRVRLLDAATLKAKSELKPPADVKAGAIDRLLFSPDGRRLAAAYHEEPSGASPGYGVLIWDVAGAKPPLRLGEVYDPLLVFAPDGKTLACRDRFHTEIRLWDVESGRRRHRWREHTSTPDGLAISPGGTVIASSDDEARLCLWDPATGKLRHALQAADDWIDGRFCRLSQDGKRLVVASFIGAFQVWDVTSGKELRRWQIDPHELRRVGVLALGVSADGSRVAAVAWIENLESTYALVWDANTGKQLCRRSYHREMHQRLNWKENRFPLFCVPDNVFSPDGERVTVSLDKRVGLEQVDTGSPLATLPEGVGGPIVFSPDGRLLAAPVLEASKAPQPLFDEKDVKGVSVIEAATGEEIVRLDSPDFAFAAFTPDSCGLVVTDAKKMCLWNAVTGKRLEEMAWPPELRGGRGKAKVCSLAVLPDGRIATGTLDSDILLWDLATTKQPRPEAAADLGETKLASLWADLGGDARKAHRGIAALATSPSRAVSFLEARLEPVKLDVRRLDRLLADLDSESFRTREAASGELTRLRYRADGKLRQALADKPSPEVRRRLEAILARPNRLPTEALRMLRAVALMERIGTPEARSILGKLAGGAAAPETRAAQQALQRLQYR